MTEIRECRIWPYQQIPKCRRLNISLYIRTLSGVHRQSQYALVKVQNRRFEKQATGSLPPNPLSYSESRNIRNMRYKIVHGWTITIQINAQMVYPLFNLPALATELRRRKHEISNLFNVHHSELKVLISKSRILTPNMEWPEAMYGGKWPAISRVTREGEHPTPFRKRQWGLLTNYRLTATPVSKQNWLRQMTPATAKGPKYPRIIVSGVENVRPLQTLLDSVASMHIKWSYQEKIKNQNRIHKLRKINFFYKTRVRKTLHRRIIDVRFLSLTNIERRAWYILAWHAEN